MFKTTAGRLSCKEIIHVAIPYSNDKLKDVVVKALQLAESGRYASVAVPALGTGILLFLLYIVNM